MNLDKKLLPGMCDHYMYIFFALFLCAMPWTLAGDHLALHMFLLATAYNADSASPQPPLNAPARHNTENQPKTTNILNSRIRIRNEQRHGRESESSLALCFFFRFLFCVMYRESREPQKKKRREERGDDDDVIWGGRGRDTHWVRVRVREQRKHIFNFSFFSFLLFSSFQFQFQFTSDR